MPFLANFIIQAFVDRTRQAASNFGKIDLKRDVMKHQKKQRGKHLMQSNTVSTSALMNQGVHEMRMKLYEQAVDNFSIVIKKENGDNKEQAYLLRSKCLTM